MPYSKLSDARIKKLDGVPLTLEQVNSIAAMADAIGGDFGWPTAIKRFKASHVVKKGKWVKRDKPDAEKELPDIFVRQKEDGRYQIVGVSTAAVKDIVGETFTTQAMDYDIYQAEVTKEYPEFRMFHNRGLGIGRVEKMMRVGIFALDIGTSYDDSFSLACCDAISKDNSSKWRMSRGFFAREVSGGCPTCGKTLLLKQNHMIAGFRCPSCKTTYLGYQGALDNVRFLKTRTFDNTITDIPCVPYTGVVTQRLAEDVLMNKKQLKQKLLDAGVPEELVDERLGTVNEKQLETLGDDIPEAALLKELDIESVDGNGSGDGDEDAQVVFLDQSVMKDMSALVRKEVKAALDDMNVEIQIPEDGAVLERLGAIEKQLEELAEVLDKLAATDATRLKQALGNAPRNAKYRIVRRKQDDDYEDDEGEDEDEDEEEMPVKRGAKKTKSLDLNPGDGVVYGTNGKTWGSLSESLLEGE